MRRRRQQQQVGHGPIELPPRVTGIETRQSLSQFVALGLSNIEVRVSVRRELVRLIEDHEIVWLDGRLLKSGEHPLACKRVDADDAQIAVFADEWISGTSVSPGGDLEREAEQLVHLLVPIANQASRRDDQHTPDQPPDQHLPDVHARHDGFPGTGIVGQ